MKNAQDNDSRARAIIEATGYVGYYLRRLRDTITESMRQAGGEQIRGTNAERKMLLSEQLLDGRYIFRGSAQAHKNDIESGAASRLKNSYKTSQREFISYHTDLIHRVKNNRYHFNTGGAIDFAAWHDLEILAELQHFGAATCLMDFTNNFLVALYFATAKRTQPKSSKISPKKGSSEDRGQVFVMDLLSPPNDEFYYINELRANDTIDVILKKRTRKHDDDANDSRPRIWLWAPTMLNNRIRRQGSIFMFSLDKLVPATISQQKAAKKIEEPNVYYRTIDIPSEHKEPVRKELETYFGLSPETIFDDFHGFAGEAHNRNVPVMGDLSSSMRCIAHGKQRYKQDRYVDAVESFSCALKCADSPKHKHGGIGEKPRMCLRDSTRLGCARLPKNELRFRRGLAYFQLGDAAGPTEGISHYLAAREDFENVWDSLRSSRLKSDSPELRLFKKVSRYLVATDYNTRDFEQALELCETLQGQEQLKSDVQEQNSITLFLLELLLFLGKRELFLETWKAARKRL